MARYLEDGEFKHLSIDKKAKVQVVAERYDWDSPYIHLIECEVIDYKDYWMSKMGIKGCVFNRLTTLTDSDARQLIKDLQTALSILPTSK